MEHKDTCRFCSESPDGCNCLTEAALTRTVEAIKAMVHDRQNRIAIRPTRFFDQYGYEYKVYGKPMQFDLEGDAYEAITGHRSAAIDEADKKRGLA